jgi:hypothetical protein
LGATAGAAPPRLIAIAAQIVDENEAALEAQERARLEAEAKARAAAEAPVEIPAAISADDGAGPVEDTPP